MGTTQEHDMTNWVDHSVTITGPAAELDRFVACWVMPAKGERFPPYVEGKFDLDYDVSRPEGELFFSFDKLTPPKPDRCDRWVLSRWGFKYVAGQATIEVKEPSSCHSRREDTGHTSPFLRSWRSYFPRW
jgi:hypothetical protein